MKYTHIVWDFNGTLIDDAAASERALNIMLRRRSLATLSGRDEYKRRFRFPLREFYADLGFDFAAEDYGVVAAEWYALYRAEEKNVPLSSGAEEALSLFRERGAAQIVLSSSEAGLLREQLYARGVGEYFDEIIGLPDHTAGSKGALGLRWARGLSDKAHVLFVGDTIHDYEVASIVAAGASVRADCALYTGGHTCREHLCACGSCGVSRVAVVDTLSDVAALAI